MAAVERTAADLGATRGTPGGPGAWQGQRPGQHRRRRLLPARDRPHFFYRLHVYHGRKGEPKTFAWHEYRDLIITAHQQLNAPLV